MIFTETKQALQLLQDTTFCAAVLIRCNRGSAHLSTRNGS